MLALEQLAEKWPLIAGGGGGVVRPPLATGLSLDKKLSCRREAVRCRCRRAAKYYQVLSACPIENGLSVCCVRGVILRPYNCSQTGALFYNNLWIIH